MSHSWVIKWLPSGVAKGKERAHCAPAVTQSLKRLYKQVWLFLPNPSHEWRFGWRLTLHLWNFSFISPPPSSVSRIQCKQTETAQVFIFRHITRRKLNFLIPGGSSPSLKRSSFWHSFTFPLRLNGTGWEKKGAFVFLSPLLIQRWLSCREHAEQKHPSVTSPPGLYCWKKVKFGSFFPLGATQDVFFSKRSHSSPALNTVDVEWGENKLWLVIYELLFCKLEIYSVFTPLK